MRLLYLLFLLIFLGCSADITKTGGIRLTVQTDAGEAAIKKRLEWVDTKIKVKQMDSMHYTVLMPGYTDLEAVLTVFEEPQTAVYLVMEPPYTHDSAYLEVVGPYDSVLRVAGAPLITGNIFAAAKIDKVNGKNVLAIDFNERGAFAFADITTEHTGRRIALVINGKAVFAPLVMAPIMDGRVIVSGDFTMAELKRLVTNLTRPLAEMSVTDGMVYPLP